MLTLFHAPRSRSSRFIWLLEELGASYEIKVVTIRRQNGEGGADPANPHPAHKVPALRDGEALITESAAIALYLTDAFPDAGMGPKLGDADRGAYLTWLAYYAGVLEPTITNRFRDRMEADDETDYAELTNRLTTTLEAGPWLLGERFSAVDILFVSLLQFARESLPPSAIFDDWLARASARPALGRALKRDEG